MDDLLVSGGRVREVRLADGRAFPADRVVLAPGNSARELYRLFAERRWPIEQKPFAVGFRAEHPQALIDRIQYGKPWRGSGSGDRYRPDAPGLASTCRTQRDPVA